MPIVRPTVSTEKDSRAPWRVSNSCRRRPGLRRQEPQVGLRVGRWGEARRRGAHRRRPRFDRERRDRRSEGRRRDHRCDRQIGQRIGGQRGLAPLRLVILEGLERGRRGHIGPRRRLGHGRPWHGPIDLEGRQAPREADALVGHRNLGRLLGHRRQRGRGRGPGLGLGVGREMVARLELRVTRGETLGAPIPVGASPVIRGFLGRATDQPSARSRPDSGAGHRRRGPARCATRCLVHLHNAGRKGHGRRS